MPFVSASQTQRPEPDGAKHQGFPGRASQRRSRRRSTVLKLLGITVVATLIGMMAMVDFRNGQPVLASILDVLPARWEWSDPWLFTNGLPFSLTLLCILLAGKSGRYLACRYFGVDPAKTDIDGLKDYPRSALIGTNAAGPIAAFAVALTTASYGLLHSPAINRHTVQPLIRFADPSVLDLLRSTMLASFPDIPPILQLLPHPVLIASWIGLLIIAVKLMPAGHSNGGEIVYAISPKLHKATSNLTIAILLYLGTVEWFGWLFAAAFLILSATKPAKLAKSDPISLEWLAMAPLCLAIFLLAITTQPIVGMNLVQVLLRMH
jgi:hypothetical protein